MIFGSVCSGVEAASVAWNPLGWEAAFFSEIEKFPSAVLAHHYPGVPNHGDMTKFKEWPDYAIDVLVGGTPCQSFSIAGLRKGLDDPRGNLMLTYLAIAARYCPRIVVWENVPGVLSSNGGRDFGTFLGGLAKLGYGFAYRVLDAQFFGVPQRRKRVFVVGCLGDWRRASAVLFERHSLSGNIAPSREKGQRIADSLTVGANQCSGFQGDFVEHTAPTIPSRSTAGGGLVTDFDCDGGLIASTGNIAHCLNAGGMGRQDYETETLIAHSGMKQTSYVRQSMQVRRLTPRECERLQGFPDDYTLIPGKAADGPRYKALGNSMAVPVMRWIGERIDAVNSIAVMPKMEVA